MNKLQLGVLVLLKSAINKEKGTLPEGFSIQEAERLIEKHQIIGLAYEGAIRCGISKNDPTMRMLFQKYCQQMLLDQKQRAALDKLFEAFEENGIDYLPVKGLDMKRLYPDPAMRTMGDADVLIRMEQYDRIREIMLQLGYSEGEQTGHELIWDSESLHLELHKQLLSSYHPDLQRYYGDGWKLARPLRGRRYTYSAEDMYIFLFAHFIKHYRKGGIGLRHVLDIWLYREDNPDMDREYVRREMTKLRLCEFHDNICLLTDYWFNGAAADEKIEFISEFIFNSGSWGTHANRVRFIALNRKKALSRDKKVQIPPIISLIFPSLKNMRLRFPILYKLPWLLPIMWPVRWATVLLFRREKIRRGQIELKYSTKQEVDEYEAALHYVGLHYDV